MRNRNGRYDAVRLYCGTSAESLPRKCKMFFDSYFNALMLMRVFKRIAIGDLSHRVQQTSRLQHRVLVLQSSAWCSALAHRLVSCEKYY